MRRMSSLSALTEDNEETNGGFKATTLETYCRDFLAEG